MKEPTTAVSANHYATYPSLRDRVVLVTGGASGIGASIVEAFVAQHSRVAFVDVQQQAGERLAARLASSYPCGPSFFACDLTETAALRDLVAQVTQTVGVVDVLLNNAANDTRHSIEEVTPESWDSIMATNLKHQFFLTQAVLPGMRQKGGGCILNMSSISWVIPSTGLPVYVTAKAGIVGLTRTLAHELGSSNIRVNAILPGAVATERQKELWFTEAYTAKILEAQAIKRILQPEEVARLALFLASDDSAGITNQAYAIDGGWT